jgi:hypothetical protein
MSKRLLLFGRLALAVAVLAVLLLAVRSPAEAAYGPSQYRLGQRSVCAAMLTEVRRGVLAIEVVSDPGAICSKLGFIVAGQGQRMRLVDCGSARNVRWLGLGRGAVCKR